MKKMTQHALYRAKQRGVGKKDIKEALRNGTKQKIYSGYKIEYKDTTIVVRNNRIITTYNNQYYGST